MQIIPTKDLKNTVETERKQVMEEARMINRGIDDYTQGKVSDGRSSLKKLRDQYGI